MGSIAKLIAEIKENRKLATQNLEGIPAMMRTGRLGLKNAAINRIPVLENIYREEIVKNAVAVVLYGDAEAQKKFAEVAEDEGRAIQVSAYALYERLASPILENLKVVKRFASNHLVMFRNELDSVLSELGVGIKGNLSLGAVLNSNTDLVNLPKMLKTWFDKEGLSNLNTLYVERIVANKALKEEYDQNVVPVVVTGAYKDDKETPGKLFGRGNVNIGIEVKSSDINNQVTKVFKRLESAFKKIKVNDKE